MKNKNLRELNYAFQETRTLFQNERAQAKKHLIYANLRLQFLEWLERGWMDEQIFKVETEKIDFKNLETEMAWQEAVLMFGDELRDDGFYVDIVGGTNNYAITWGYGAPRTDEEKEETRKIIKEHMEERKTGLAYSERKKLDEFFHALMNMKPKESVFFHERHSEFMDMIKVNSAPKDTYQAVMAKISKPNKKLKGKSALEVFLSKKK